MNIAWWHRLVFGTHNPFRAQMPGFCDGIGSAA